MSKHKSDLFIASDYWHPKFWMMWLSLAALRLVSFLPFKMMLACGRLLGNIIRLASGSRQRIIDTNLRHCFPELDEKGRGEIKIACYQNIGISLMEMAMCWWWPEDKLKQMVEIRGQEHIDKELKNGRGVILLTGHFTSLEIGARLLALYMPVQVMYRTQRNRLFDSFLYTHRCRYFVNTISRKNTRSLIKGIKNQIPTWYAPDQDFRKERNVFAPFFNVQTATITASSRLAQSSGGAMLPYYPERKKDGSGYILWIQPALDNFPSGDDSIDATAVNTSIESFVRQHPEHYMWIHQRFKTRPPGEERFYQ